MLESLFSHVCHQEPSRCWTVGGALLPFCQRCTGVHLGALLAALFWLSFGGRPRGLPPGPLVGLNLAFILAMGLFGFHVIETPPLGRYLSGAAFGSALIVLAWPLAARRLGAAGAAWSRGDVLRYFIFITVLAALPMAGPWLDSADWSAGLLVALGAAGLALVVATPSLLLAALAAGSQPERRRLPLAAAVWVGLMAAEIVIVSRAWRYLG